MEQKCDATDANNYSKCDSSKIFCLIKSYLVEKKTMPTAIFNQNIRIVYGHDLELVIVLHRVFQENQCLGSRICDASDDWHQSDAVSWFF